MLAEIVGGLAIGTMLGLLGGGGALLAIPTSLAIIALNSLSGMAGYWEQLPLGQASFQWLMLTGMLGSILGYQLSQKLSSQMIKRSFALFLLALIAIILIFPPQSG